MFASTPKPPYYAVIFTSVRTEGDNGYEQMSKQMIEAGSAMPGFLGIESARDEIGITVSYWDSLENIKAWKEHAQHRLAQKGGKAQWYSSYKIRICLVE